MSGAAANIVSAVVNAMSSLLENSSDTLVGPLVSLAGAVMLPWLLLELLKMMSITHDQNPATVIARIFNRLMLYLFIMAICNFGGISIIADQIVVPLFSGIVELGNELNSAIVGGTASCNVTGSSGVLASFNQSSAGSGAYGSLASKLSSAICQTSGTFYKGIGVGIYMVTHSFWVYNLVPHFSFSLLFGGAVIVVIYLFLFLRLPLIFADALIKFGLTLMMLPVIILAYLFGPTRAVVKQAITGSIAAALSVFFTVVLSGVCVKLIDSVMVTIVEKANNVGSEVVREMGPFDMTDFISIVLVGLMTSAIIRSAPKIAAEFVQFQGSMGDAAGAAGGAAKGLAMGVVGVGGAAVGGIAAKAALGKAGGAVQGMISKSVAQGMTSFADAQQKDSGKG